MITKGHKHTRASAFDLAGRIQRGEVKSTEVVEAHIAQIQSVNPKLNAVIENRFDSARDEAKIVDRTIAAGNFDFQKQPLAGVPFTMKEMISVEGMHSTLGSVHRKENLKSDDATVVARLRNAGGVLLGTTNVPEVGLWFECWNKVYGTTSNPYDNSRTSGGSSGGEAAIISAGGSPFGIGSDIGGSIRIPAAFCGIYGHKPSNFIVPMTGHTPLYKTTAKEFSGTHYPLTVLGPMARRAKDLRGLMNLIIGKDAYDSNCQDYSLDSKPVDWKKITVYQIDSPILHGCSETTSEVSAACKDTGDFFRNLGAKVVELNPEIFIHAIQLWFARTAQYKTADFIKVLNPTGDISFTKEILSSFIGRGDYTLPSTIMAILEKTTSMKKPEDKWMEELLSLQAHINQLLGNSGILIMPVHPRVAPKHKRTLLAPFDFAYTGIFNALMVPASSAPVRLSTEGLPIGVQIVAGDKQDHLCLAACEAIDDGLGGWLSPE